VAIIADFGIWLAELSALLYKKIEDRGWVADKNRGKLITKINY
jgi:hypothetical protein